MTKEKEAPKSLFEAEPCQHPKEMREWVGHVMYCHKPKGGCGAELRRDAEAGEPKKEPCGATATCQHAGADCTDEGFTNRKGECFEELPGALNEVEKTEESLIFTETLFPGEGSSEEPNQQEPEDGEVVDAEFTADDGTVVGSVDASASIPNLSEAMVTGETVNVTRLLPVAINEEDLAAHGEEMGRLIGIWKRAKIDKEKYDKAAKKLIDDTEMKWLSIALIVDSGAEEREIPCVLIYDYPHGVKRVYRCDTNTLVEETTLTTEELQGSLNFSVESSVAAVEALRGEQEPETEEAEEESPFDEVAEQVQDEQDSAETGEQAEADTSVAVEQGKAVTDENGEPPPEGYVDRPEDCKIECLVQGLHCPETCGELTKLAGVSK
jgi:hypothetical protein